MRLGSGRPQARKPDQAAQSGGAGSRGAWRGLAGGGRRARRCAGTGRPRRSCPPPDRRARLTRSTGRCFLFGLPGLQSRDGPDDDAATERDRRRKAARPHLGIVSGIGDGIRLEHVPAAEKTH
jgi:hypothetical protein